MAYASVNDIGRVVSPTIVRGQIEGGAVQGIGQALSERVSYDVNSGQLLSASFMDYALPHVDIVRSIKTEFDTSIPCKTNPLGVKGAGEAGVIPVPALFASALDDALAPFGMRVREMPLHPCRLSELLREAEQARQEAKTDSTDFTA